MSRRIMREILVHTLYEYSFETDTLAALAARRLCPACLCALCAEGAPYEKALKPEDLAQWAQKAADIEENLPVIDEVIMRHARGWEKQRISRILLAILRVAAYEILFEETLDDSVAANEAVLIAKGYEEKDGVGFVNGILGAIVREKEAR